MKLLRIKLFVTVIVFLISTKVAFAAGIAVTPSELSFNLMAGQSETREIYIQNLSVEPVIFNIYLDELEDQIWASPDNFRLDSGEKQKVKIMARPIVSGTIATNISVVAQDLDRRKFNVSTGAKVPVYLTVAPVQVNKNIVILKKTLVILFPLAIFVIIVLWLNYHRRKKWYQRFGDKINLLRHHKKPWWKRIF